jgi:hypothetical protein
MTTNFFSPLDPGSRMGKNHDPGSGKNIPDPQHCREEDTQTRTICAQSVGGVDDQRPNNKKKNLILKLRQKSEITIRHSGKMRY